MLTKKFLISAVVMAVIYLSVSYTFSLIFSKEFNLVNRSISAVIFGIVITAFQAYWAKKKR